MKNIKKELQKFYAKYPCGGERLEDEAQCWVPLWMLEAFEYGQHRGELALDIGCGTGRDLQRFAKEGTRCVGIDLSENVIQIAKRRLLGMNLMNHVDLIICDLENLPFKDNVFDLSYSAGVLHHTPNHIRGLEEMYRTLKPCGKTIMLLYHKYSTARIIVPMSKAISNIMRKVFREDSPRRLLEFIMRRQMKPDRLSVFGEMTEHPHIKYFSARQVRKLLHGVGFVEPDIQLFDGLFPISRYFPSISKFLQPLFGRSLIVKANKKETIS